LFFDNPDLADKLPVFDFQFCLLAVQPFVVGRPLDPCYSAKFDDRISCRVMKLPNGKIEGLVSYLA